MPGTRSSAPTKCISLVPGLAKQTLTSLAISVRTRLSAPFIARPRQSDWIVEGLGQRGEQLRPLLCHVPAVLQADPEFARDIDTGLVGKAHSRLQRCRVVAHEIGILVSVEANAVPGTMRQARQRIVLAPPFGLIE